MKITTDYIGPSVPPNSIFYEDFDEVMTLCYGYFVNTHDI